MMSKEISESNDNGGEKMSLAMQMCIAHRQNEPKKSDPMQRALKMPQTEFERTVSECTINSITNHQMIAEKFNVTPEDVKRRGEDLRLW